MEKKACTPHALVRQSVTLNTPCDVDKLIYFTPRRDTGLVYGMCVHVICVYGMCVCIWYSCECVCIRAGVCLCVCVCGLLMCAFVRALVWKARLEKQLQANRTSITD